MEEARGETQRRPFSRSNGTITRVVKAGTEASPAISPEVRPPAGTAPPRHVVITGASSGIGAALARNYSRPGGVLSLTGRNAERLDCIAAACRARGAVVEVERLDVTDAVSMANWLCQRDADLPVDLVIANAGIGGAQVLTGASGEDGNIARHVLQVNVIGVVNTVSPLLKPFVLRRRGHIAIISSVAAFLGLPDAPAYSASKAAVRVYGEALRRCHALDGIRVSVVCPGFVGTPMSATLPFRTPFLWTAEKAARRIADDLTRGKAEIVFPWQLRVAAKLTHVLPPALVDLALVRLTTRLTRS